MSTVRTNLRTALRTCVLEMTQAAGYFYNYTEVFDPALNMENMTTFPCVNIILGREDRIGDKYMGNNPILDISMPVQFDVFLNDINDTSLAVDKAIADFQKYFGVNYYVKPTGGNRTAFNMVWASSTPWGTEVEVPNCGVTLEFDLFYSIQLTNPLLMV